jgi:HSP20 family protein
MFLVPLTRNSTELARSFDRLFDDGMFERFFNPARGEGTPANLRSPALDVAETERGYTVKLDLPGIAKDDVKIAIEGRRITVEAETSRTDQSKDGEKVLYTERSMSSFARSFTLPTEVDQAESSAKMENGVLTLALAKRGASKASQLTVS